MNNRTTPKDFFLHLGATVALYASAIALINLSFSVINFWQPDKLAGYFSPSYIAWPISMLIVLVPTLYVLEWLLVRDMRLVPEKKDLWVRRWRIYLTLFLSGATIVGDLIALINTYLSGEITSRFVWKIAAILVICGVVFAYYLLARVMDESRGRTAKRSIAIAGIVIVVAAIVSGFVIVGSPAKQRALRFDQERINDLQTIQWQVISYWQRKEALPPKLEDTIDSISGNPIPTDPDTGAQYGYAVKGPLKFEICADFSLGSEDLKGRGQYGYGAGGSLMARDTSYAYSDSDQNFEHKAGKACFTRTIDPDQYPPVRPVEKLYY